MKLAVVVLIVLATCVWLVFGAFFIGYIDWPALPIELRSLSGARSFADLGNAFGAFSALLSPIALILALLSIIVQSRHQIDSNVIGAFAARQNFLLADCERLENKIQELKHSGSFDKALFENMVSKQRRQRQESEKIDIKLKNLLPNS